MNKPCVQIAFTRTVSTVDLWLSAPNLTFSQRRICVFLSGQDR